MSQSQEIGRIYEQLNKDYKLDFDELIYGKDGFMQTVYPNGFPDFKGDIIYAPKYWEEFEEWLSTKDIYLQRHRAIIYHKEDVLFDKTFDTQRELLKRVKDYYYNLWWVNEKSKDIADKYVLPVIKNIENDIKSYEDKKICIYSNVKGE